MSAYFYDDFKNLDQWQSLTFEKDDINRTGYKHLDEHGNIIPEPWNKAPGRWAAMVNKHHDRTLKCLPSGGLEMRCHVVDKPNPWRESFDAVYKGEDHYFGFGDCIPYTPWLSSGAREWSNTVNRHVLDYDQPTWLYGPGVEIIWIADFTQMCVRNLRASNWDMNTFELDTVLPLIGLKKWSEVGREELIERLANLPTEKQPQMVMGGDSAYNASLYDGCENDILEYQYSERSNNSIKEVISQKLVVGAGQQEVDGQMIKGDTPLPGPVSQGGIVANDKWAEIRRAFRENPRMEIKCRWNPDGSYEYFINGILTNVDKRQNRTLVRNELTLELCAGLKNNPDTTPGQEELKATGPKRQFDAGLSGEPWILDKDIIHRHKTTTHSLEVRLLDRPTQVSVPDTITEAPMESTDRMSAICERMEKTAAELSQTAAKLAASESKISMLAENPDVDLGQSVAIIGVNPLAGKKEQLDAIDKGLSKLVDEGRISFPGYQRNELKVIPPQQPTVREQEKLKEFQPHSSKNFPWVSEKTATTAKIHWHTLCGGQPGELRYGETKECVHYREPREESDKYPEHMQELEDLRPDTEYYAYAYDQIGGSYKTGIFSFRTEKAQGSKPVEKPVQKKSGGAKSSGTQVDFSKAIPFGRLKKSDWTGIFGTPVRWSQNDNMCEVGSFHGKNGLRVTNKPTSKGSERVQTVFDVPVGQKYRIKQSIFFEPGWSWGGTRTRTGGKIGFGLFGGKAPSGGRYAKDGFSARFVWRENFLTTYTYFADMPDKYGHPHRLEGFVPPIGEWFTLELEVGMNSKAGRNDGSLRVWANGEMLVEDTTMQWFGAGTPQIDTIGPCTFYGGNSSDYSPPHDTYAVVADVEYEKLA